MWWKSKFNKGFDQLIGGLDKTCEGLDKTCEGLRKISKGLGQQIMLTETQFETTYVDSITIHSLTEGVSFSSALYNLYLQYQSLEGSESKFDVLLKEWGLKTS